MKWCIVTYDGSKDIRLVQQVLLNKYAPDQEIHYIDVGSEDVNTWGHNVLKRLPDDEFIVFGLDDYLPTNYLSTVLFEVAYGIMKESLFERFELSCGAHRKIDFIQRTSNYNSFLEYGRETPYSVSCQFSIWRTQALKIVLSQSTTPWNFEVKHRCRAACFDYGVLQYIEESALSKRWHGINVNGLRKTDVDALIQLGLLDETKLINRYDGI